MSQKEYKENEEVVQEQHEQEATSKKKNKKAAKESKSDKMQSELDAYKADLEKEKDKFLRLFAEFENYKKRTSKERVELFKTAGQDVMLAMLPVLDDFDRAMQEINKSEDKDLLKGVELISNKLRETLKGKGLELVEVSQGDTFDSEIHEAITQIPAPQDNLKGKVVDVVEKGYKLGERIIRYPKVVVGQ